MSMSIAIQAVASLQPTANLPVAAPTALATPLSRTTEKPAALVIATEFQQGSRNARIELLASGEHSVLCYDAATDYNELLVRQSIQSAMASAEAWVKHQF
jgi:hypothetical protein